MDVNSLLQGLFCSRLKAVANFVLKVRKGGVLCRNRGIGKEKQ